jgi:hypothetical protein
MATYSRVLLSGSTSGKPIPINNAATTIHTAVAGASSWDEIYLWASNVTAAAVTLSIEWGGSTDPGELMTKTYSIPAYSAPIPIATGQVLNGGLVCKGIAGSAYGINVTGYVNRIT